MSENQTNMKLKLGNPEKISFIHFLLHKTWFQVWILVWYKRITITGKKNLKTKNPIIFAPNHQNTLMDALAVMGTQNRQVTWLARADIFKNRYAAKMLQYMKIMPAYRMQDGIKNIDNNDIVFNKCVEILEHKKAIALFPEATHWGFRRLRPTKKAAARIACMAEEKNNFTLGIEIIPVGIYFDNYTNIRRNLLVNYGEPIYVKEYEESYKNNPQQAQNELRIRLEQEMKKYMIHIPHSNELYTVYEMMREICEKKTIAFYSFDGPILKRNFDAHKKIIDLLENENKSNPELISNLSIDVLEYKDQLSKLNMRDWLIASNGGDAFQIIWNFLKLLAGLPIFIIGFLTHFLKFYYFDKLTKKLAKDVQFYNTLNFMLSMISIPIFYSIYGLIYIIVTPFAWWTVFIFLFGILQCGIIAFEYYIVYKKTYNMIRFHILDSIDDPKINIILKNRKKIIKTFSTLLK